MKLIDEITLTLNIFTDKLVEITNYRYFIDKVSKKTLESYQKQYENFKNGDYGDPEKHENIIGFNTMSSWDIRTNRRETVGHTSYSLEDLVRTTRLHHNKQYQWLLVEAYEAFEDYLSRIYAYVGYKDHTFWFAKDFGDISIDELKKKDLKWFKNRVENKDKKPESIYIHFRKKMPLIELFEKNNPQNIDYKFKILLISKLRHQIVHTRGIICDIDNFTEKILKPWSQEKQEIKQKYKDNIFYFLREEDSKYHVWLLDYNYNEEKNSDTQYARLEEFIAELSAYATLLKDISTMYLSGVPLSRQMATDVKVFKDFVKDSEMYRYLREEIKK
ncbi:MAG: hypothetical protein WC279_08980 [Sulfurimonas sp.]|jgi:heat shock protein HspQ|uniref:hypothetical protein n=1 Tax=unclassified Sulfurimonas TaxID=2623549 RepID=UPI0008B5E253|nr:MULTISPECIES: hypothetical protein [unclassified Sulfurimonas]MBS4069245.1 hypothetical protein [Sulfurimonas sp.]MDD3856119.1 hypothetical protein [Sulfurimonas sp.]OHE04471.1 MAG: hypothetical protein A2345_01710 [Sulfurimonas sp. RIFOXYB12_FULL_35_9]OHE18924.1 MAG: hypothetical protein A2525_11780 [Sulfurimonas sp. RIFOXYD12_FULL_36_11]